MTSLLLGRVLQGSSWVVIELQGAGHHLSADTDQQGLPCFQEVWGGGGCEAIRGSLGLGMLASPFHGRAAPFLGVSAPLHSAH